MSMDHAYEEGMWRAIGQLEGGVEEMRDSLEKVRRRDRVSFAIALFLGLALAQIATAIGPSSHDDRVSDAGRYGIDKYCASIGEGL
jgi:hypothetical protein